MGRGQLLMVVSPDHLPQIADELDDGERLIRRGILKVKRDRIMGSVMTWIFDA